MATKLQIPEPCSEKWSKMTPIRHDCRHCAACDKQIVDFTKKTDAEILDQLRHNSGKICGKFRPDQLGRTLLVPRAVKRGGLTGMAASLAAILAAQQPLEGQTVQPASTALAPSAPSREIYGNVAQYNYLEPDSMRTISGKVLDEHTGEPLLGAFISFAQTNIGTITDVDGSFSLSIPLDALLKNPLQIQLHYLGYLDKIIDLPLRLRQEDLSLAPSQTLMTEDTQAFEGMLGEVVREKHVLGYRPSVLKLRIRRFFHQLFH